MVDIDPVDHQPIRIRNINLNIFAKDNFIARVSPAEQTNSQQYYWYLNIRNIFI